MKKAALSIFALLIAGVLAMTACSSPTDSQSSASQSAPQMSSVQQSQPVSSIASVSTSEAASSSANATIGEDEAAEISQKLYKDGYLAHLSIMREDGPPSGSITVDGINYYIQDNLPQTRVALEEYIGAAFSSAFVQRNIGTLMNGNENGYIKIVEQNGQLYYREAGGIGGTYELATDTIAISDFTNSGWTFTMLGLTLDYDSGEFVPDEEYNWTFNVILENDEWYIDSFEGMYIDGSGHVVY